MAVPSHPTLPDTLRSLNVSRLGPLVFMTAVVCMNYGWNDTDTATQKFKEKNLLYNATSSTTNIAWTDVGSVPGRHDTACAA